MFTQIKQLMVENGRGLLEKLGEFIGSLSKSMKTKNNSHRYVVLSQQTSETGILVAAVKGF